MSKIIETMRDEAREAILETLEDGYSGYYCDLHNELFNTGWYYDLEPTVATCRMRAETILGNDVYEAIGRIYEYEKVNFGEVFTDLSNPARILSMLYYIVGEEVLYNLEESGEEEFTDLLTDNWNDEATDEINQKLLDIIKK